MSPISRVVAASLTRTLDEANDLVGRCRDRYTAAEEASKHAKRRHRDDALREVDAAWSAFMLAVRHQDWAYEQWKALSR